MNSESLRCPAVDVLRCQVLSPCKNSPAGNWKLQSKRSQTNKFSERERKTRQRAKAKMWGGWPKTSRKLAAEMVMVHSEKNKRKVTGFMLSESAIFYTVVCTGPASCLVRTMGKLRVQNPSCLFHSWRPVILHVPDIALVGNLSTKLGSGLEPALTSDNGVLRMRRTYGYYPRARICLDSRIIWIPTESGFFSFSIIGSWHIYKIQYC